MVTKTLHRFYRAMQRRQPEVLWYGSESRREIALTFDDGPHPRDTPGVLDVLSKHKVRATFFLIGMDAERNGRLVKQIHEDGHEIGIHCYRHLPFPWENPQTLRSHLVVIRHTIAGLCSLAPEAIRGVRPPYGLFNAKTLSLINELALRPVMWNCIPPHFLQPLSWSIRQVMEAVVPGSIIVLHDGHGHGRKTAHIVDTVVPQLQARGFEFVTIGHMQDRKHQ
jgi:peptidoglycan/xylan/chitin deacetylase (PgdA/CDA1 family)